MKKTLLIIVIIFLSENTNAQILPGTLEVSGMPDFSQSPLDLVSEAGLDDITAGFESVIDASQVGFTLDPLLLPFTTSEVMCEGNVYRYTLYIHTQNIPKDVQIAARTFVNSGSRFPEVSTYDDLPVQPLGPRDLTPANGGAYVTLSNNANEAVKILEFIGCRTQIPIQFKINPSVLAEATSNSFEIYYTIVASLM